MKLYLISYPAKTEVRRSKIFMVLICSIHFFKLSQTEKNAMECELCPIKTS